MEIQTSSILGSARLVLQVVTGRQKPVLEIYHELRNRMSPEEEYSCPHPPGGDKESYRLRTQEIFLQFVLINIGSVRAEDVRLRFEGTFARTDPRSPIAELELFQETIPQIAPAQIIYLFQVDHDDLHERTPEGKMGAMKDDGFTITATYNGPNAGINRLTRWWSALRKRAQHTQRYTFNPRIIRTDLPPIEYA